MCWLFCGVWAQVILIVKNFIRLWAFYWIVFARILSFWSFYVVKLERVVQLNLIFSFVSYFFENVTEILVNWIISAKNEMNHNKRHMQRNRLSLSKILFSFAFTTAVNVDNRMLFNCYTSTHSNDNFSHFSDFWMMFWWINWTKINT